MTIADEIRLEEREASAFKWIKILIQTGATIEFIAKSSEMPIEKVEEIVSKIKASYN
jgi:hypothetical protein